MQVSKTNDEYRGLDFIHVLANRSYLFHERFRLGDQVVIHVFSGRDQSLRLGNVNQDLRDGLSLEVPLGLLRVDDLLGTHGAEETGLTLEQFYLPELRSFQLVDGDFDLFARLVALGAPLQS